MLRLTELSSQIVRFEGAAAEEFFKLLLSSRLYDC
jgi:hypothetical protein